MSSYFSFPPMGDNDTSILRRRRPGFPEPYVPDNAIQDFGSPNVQFPLNLQPQSISLPQDLQPQDMGSIVPRNQMPVPYGVRSPQPPPSQPVDLRGAGAPIDYSAQQAPSVSVFGGNPQQVEPIGNPVNVAPPPQGAILPRRNPFINGDSPAMASQVANRVNPLMPTDNSAYSLPSNPQVSGLPMNLQPTDLGNQNLGRDDRHLPGTPFKGQFPAAASPRDMAIPTNSYRGGALNTPGMEGGTRLGVNLGDDPNYHTAAAYQQAINADLIARNPNLAEYERVTGKPLIGTLTKGGKPISDQDVATYMRRHPGEKMPYSITPEQQAEFAAFSTDGGQDWKHDNPAAGEPRPLLDLPDNSLAKGYYDYGAGFTQGLPSFEAVPSALVHYGSGLMDLLHDPSRIAEGEKRAVISEDDPIRQTLNNNETGTFLGDLYNSASQGFGGTKAAATYLAGGFDLLKAARQSGDPNSTAFKVGEQVSSIPSTFVEGAGGGLGKAAMILDSANKAAGDGASPEEISNNIVSGAVMLAAAEGLGHFQGPALGKFAEQMEASLTKRVGSDLARRITQRSMAGIGHVLNTGNFVAAGGASRFGVEGKAPNAEDALTDAKTGLLYSLAGSAVEGAHSSNGPLKGAIEAATGGKKINGYVVTGTGDTGRAMAVFSDGSHSEIPIGAVPKSGARIQATDPATFNQTFNASASTPATLPGIESTTGMGSNGEVRDPAEGLEARRARTREGYQQKAKDRASAPIQAGQDRAAAHAADIANRANPPEMDIGHPITEHDPYGEERLGEFDPVEQKLRADVAKAALAQGSPSEYDDPTTMTDDEKGNAVPGGPALDALEKARQLRIIANGGDPNSTANQSITSNPPPVNQERLLRDKETTAQTFQSLKDYNDKLPDKPPVEWSQYTDDLRKSINRIQEDLKTAQPDSPDTREKKAALTALVHHYNDISSGRRVPPGFEGKVPEWKDSPEMKARLGEAWTKQQTAALRHDSATGDIDPEGRQLADDTMRQTLRSKGLSLDSLDPDTYGRAINDAQAHKNVTEIRRHRDSAKDTLRSEQELLDNHGSSMPPEARRAAEARMAQAQHVLDTYGDYTEDINANPSMAEILRREAAASKSVNQPTKSAKADLATGESIAEPVKPPVNNNDATVEPTAPPVELPTRKVANDATTESIDTPVKPPTENAVTKPPVKKPSWMSEMEEQTTDLLSRSPGLGDKMEQLARQGKSYEEIAKILDSDLRKLTGNQATDYSHMSPEQADRMRVLKGGMTDESTIVATELTRRGIPIGNSYEHDAWLKGLTAEKEPANVPPNPVEEVAHESVRPNTIGTIEANAVKQPGDTGATDTHGESIDSTTVPASIPTTTQGEPTVPIPERVGYTNDEGDGGESNTGTAPTDIERGPISSTPRTPNTTAGEGGGDALRTANKPTDISPAQQAAQERVDKAEAELKAAKGGGFMRQFDVAPAAQRVREAKEALRAIIKTEKAAKLSRPTHLNGGVKEPPKPTGIDEIDSLHAKVMAGENISPSKTSLSSVDTPDKLRKMLFENTASGGLKRYGDSAHAAISNMTAEEYISAVQAAAKSAGKPPIGEEGQKTLKEEYNNYVKQVYTGAESEHNNIIGNDEFLDQEIPSGQTSSTLRDLLVKRARAVGNTDLVKKLDGTEPIIEPEPDNPIATEADGTVSDEVAKQMESSPVETPPIKTPKGNLPPQNPKSAVNLIIQANQAKTIDELLDMKGQLLTRVASLSDGKQTKKMAAQVEKLKGVQAFIDGRIAEMTPKDEDIPKFTPPAEVKSSKKANIRAGLDGSKAARGKNPSVVFGAMGGKGELANANIVPDWIKLPAKWAGGAVYDGAIRLADSIANSKFGKMASEIKRNFAPSSVSPEARQAQDLLNLHNAMRQANLQAQLSDQSYIDAAKEFATASPEEIQSAREGGGPAPSEKVQELLRHLTTAKTIIDKYGSTLQKESPNEFSEFVEKSLPFLFKDSDRAAQIIKDIRTSEGSSATPGVGVDPALETTSRKTGKPSLPVSAYYDKLIANGLEPKEANPVLSLGGFSNMVENHLSGLRLQADSIRLGVIQHFPIDAVPTGWSKVEGAVGVQRTKAASKPVSNVFDQTGARSKTIDGGQFVTEKTDKTSQQLYAPDSVAHVYNTMLGAPDGNKKWEATTDFLHSIRGATQIAQTALSAYHFWTITHEASINEQMIAQQKLANGDIKGALGNYMRSILPGHAGAMYYMKGREATKAFLDPEYAKANPEAAARKDAVLRAGGTLGTPSQYETHFGKEVAAGINQAMSKTATTSEKAAGMWRAIKNLPLGGAELFSKPLSWYIDNAKVAAFHELMIAKGDKLDPTKVGEMDINRLYNQTWDEIENRMGHVNYDRWGLDNMTKQAMFALVNFPGWNGGTLKQLGGGISDLTGTLGRVKAGGDRMTDKMHYWLAATTHMAMMGFATNLVLTGQLPGNGTDEDPKTAFMKDILYPRNGKIGPDGTPERLNQPTIVKDILPMGQALAAAGGGDLAPATKFLGSKFSTTLGSAFELLSNKDYFGNQIYRPGSSAPRDVFNYLVKRMTPFSLKDVNAQIKNQGYGDAAWEVTKDVLGYPKASGEIAETRFQRNLKTVYNQKYAAGGLTVDTQEMLAGRKDLRTAVDNGDLNAISRAMDKQEITSKQGKELLDAADTTSYERKFAKMDLPTQADLFSTMSKAERDHYAPALIDKMETLESGNMPPMQQLAIVDKLQTLGVMPHINQEKYRHAYTLATDKVKYQIMARQMPEFDRLGEAGQRYVDKEISSVISDYKSVDKPYMTERQVEEDAKASAKAYNEFLKSSPNVMRDLIKQILIAAPSVDKEDAEDRKMGGNRTKGTVSNLDGSPSEDAPSEEDSSDGQTLDQYMNSTGQSRR